MPAPDDRLRILLLEDEALLALDLAELLEAEGYAVVGPARTGARARELFASQRVDLLLCDIRLQGPDDGIETARYLLAQRSVPLIYLTSLSDPATLARALPTSPAAYLPKPVTVESLRTAIALALHHFALPKPGALSPGLVPAPAATESEALTRETLLQLDQHIFVKYQQQFVRVALADVLLLEAGNSHTTLATASRRYALRLPLNAVLERLHAPALVRVHRSFAVNIQQVEAFSEQGVTVGGQVVPLGRHYREEFLRRFQFR